jgi:hypothetical protein
MRVRKKIQAVLWSDHAPLKPLQSIVATRSGSKVNIFDLAKSAGTPVDQIERFYARNLSLSRETAIKVLAATM